MKRSKILKKKKFIMELLGDPLYKPMRLREIASLLQLDKSEKKELLMCWTSFVPRERRKWIIKEDTARFPASAETDGRKR